MPAAREPRRDPWTIWCLRALLVSMMLWTAQALADTDTVVRSRMPDGTTAYGDGPQAGAVSTQQLEIESHPADPAAAARAVREVELARQRMAAQIAQHEAQGEALDARLCVALEQLQQARTRRTQGQDIREGDRQGRRLTPEYRNRLAGLDEQVRSAEDEVARLRRQRAALGH
ncbi:MAG: hypothetical protein J0H69_08625 [Burkholderiales bacterium]|nr:hypothetical protein [Burkholderiales bacterium]